MLEECMKKWLLLGFAVIAVVLIAFLGQPAVDPEDFTGEWYSTDGQNIYRFQNGIIHCDKHNISLADDSIFSGAYIFSGKSVVLFTMGIEGIETEQKLYGYLEIIRNNRNTNDGNGAHSSYLLTEQQLDSNIKAFTTLYLYVTGMCLEDIKANYNV
jgi:hypothetical protein